MKRVLISGEPISEEVALSGLSDLGGGAVSSFTGISRDDGGVTAIELEHYPGMTESSLLRLIDEAFARWALLGAAIVHRIGRVAVGEPVVVVGAASRHRADALEATAFLIDRLKTDAPFWKKEHYADGMSVWVDAKSSDDDRSSRWS
ncbi:MAG: molybdenum cofactor biosynthesis protein MoaE [Sphingomonadaceae bacterium]|jgi:molybdopterin synthase catalytic subunit|uniref:molybdenum cofactor biosynthesis protein MoaE n=1 Tax=Sphingorhabdus sp. TaxID=1902408 RepID=UPI0039BC5E68|nr:molybdenum cofactor biosynthesis protein MoaE [Sphingomonadaceae bacterium]